MVDTDLRQDRAIASRIPVAWSAFFESFGRLTEVQRAAIPSIVAGGNALIVSPTASGKTEAVCAPLVERHYGTSGSWTILYISPTRALVNDLYHRLSRPLDRLSLKLRRRTGDHRDNLEQANVILTTPESFDSLLCRGKIPGKQDHILSSVVAIVLDEIHLLDGSPRGEQTRWLIERLRRLREQAKRDGWSRTSSVQLVGLSATIPDPKSVAERYLDQAEIIQTAGARPVEVVVPAHEDPRIETGLVSYIESLTEPQKLLVFTNSRKRADELTMTLGAPLAQLGYRTATHHGSLALGERQVTEESIRSAEKILVVATSTLEIGIDIGDIDLVVLDGPAPDLKALLQRIGRGNRRTDKTKVMLFGGSFVETIVHEAMINAVKDGWIGRSKAGPEYAVARQQVASYIFQAPGRSRPRKRIEILLGELGPESIREDLLDEMLRLDELIEDGSGLRLGETWEEKCESGLVHSNIESTPGLTVVDETSGHILAQGLRPGSASASRLSIGGNRLEVRNWNDRKLEVRRLQESGANDDNWGYISRAWFKGDDQPQAVKRYLEIGEDVWPVVRTGNACHVFHFGGARRKAFLQLVSNLRAALVNEWYVTITNFGQDKPSWASDVAESDIDLAVSQNLEEIERTLSRPRANQYIPLKARIDEVKGWLESESEIQFLQDSVWETNLDEETQMVLSNLIKASL